MGFRKFTEYGAASRTQLTIRTNDLLFISKASLAGFSNNIKFAIFHIDEEGKLVGVEFLGDKPSEPYRKITEERAGVSINMAPILRFFGIGKLSKKYIADYKIENGMLVFSIKDLIIAEKEKTASAN